MKILNVAKAALYGIFLNYYGYYVVKGSFIPGGTVLFLGLALLCVGVDAWKRRYLYVATEIRYWLAYGLISLISTALVTAGSGDFGFVGDIVKYIQRVGIILLVAYICEREGSIRFGLQLMAVTAVVLAISVFSVLGDYQQKLNITSNADLSANDTGAIMACGCFAVMFAWGKRNRSSLLLSALKMTGVIFCVVIIFLAGSRKSIYAVVIMLVLILLLCFTDYAKSLDVNKILILTVIGVVAYQFIEALLPYAENTNLYTRLFGRGVESAEASDKNRIQLITWAMQDFAEHPFFGLGFNEFRKYHGNYTHSTYAEPLCCTGMIGLLYLYPYYRIVKKQLYLIWVNKKGTYARLKQKEIFVYMCMVYFIAVGIPYMYKDAPCIVLGTFIASQTISFRELRKMGHTSSEY